MWDGTPNWITPWKRSYDQRKETLFRYTKHSLGLGSWPPCLVSIFRYWLQERFSAGGSSPCRKWDFQSERAHEHEVAWVFLCRWEGWKVGKGGGDIGGINWTRREGGYGYRSIYLHCYGDTGMEGVRWAGEGKEVWRDEEKRKKKEKKNKNLLDICCCEIGADMEVSSHEVGIKKWKNVFARHSNTYTSLSTFQRLTTRSSSWTTQRPNEKEEKNKGNKERSNWREKIAIKLSLPFIILVNSRSSKTTNAPSTIFHCISLFIPEREQERKTKGLVRQRALSPPLEFSMGGRRARKNTSNEAQ